MQTDSIATWIVQLKAGDQAAAQPLWERYFSRLVTLARSRIRVSRRAEDEEDIALSAFDSFCRGAAAGRFPRLNDKNDLWRILVTIVSRKVYDQYRREHRVGQGVTVEIDWGAVSSADPSPDFAAEVAEECERLLRHLNDEILRSIALWKMEGFTAKEIADRLSCATRTVERKLRMIRRLWAAEPEGTSA